MYALGFLLYRTNCNIVGYVDITLVVSFQPPGLYPQFFTVLAFSLIFLSYEPFSNVKDAEFPHDYIVYFDNATFFSTFCF